MKKMKIINKATSDSLSNLSSKLTAGTSLFCTKDKLGVQKCLRIDNFSPCGLDSDLMDDTRFSICDALPSDKEEDILIKFGLIIPYLLGHHEYVVPSLGGFYNSMEEYTIKTGKWESLTNISDLSVFPSTIILDAVYMCVEIPEDVVLYIDNSILYKGEVLNDNEVFNYIPFSSHLKPGDGLCVND